MSFWARVRELRRYPSAMVGLAVVGLLLFMSVYAVVRYPYSEAIRLWRAGETTWLENPRNAQPRWFNWFGADLPETIRVEHKQARVLRTEDLGGGVRRQSLSFSFDFLSRTAFPKELALFFEAQFAHTPPRAVLVWRTPDGREIPLGTQVLKGSGRYIISADAALVRRLGGRPPHEALFASPTEPNKPLRGRYELLVELLTFDAESRVQLKLIVYGQAHGWAGTDNIRRDLSIALLWGAPIAMAFGMSAALVLTLWYLTVSAVGAWFGGWVDALVDRLTELRMILPLLTILIMVGMFWSRSLWVILAVLIGYGIIGGNKSYRAMYLQTRNLPYLEAARAYGAGNLRIIFRYLVPRFLPLTIPAFIQAIPGYVFLEASLAILGLGDPVLPTWGKVINEAQAFLYMGSQYYYWILLPAALLFLTGVGFAMIGFTLDRIFNPRLRSL